MPENIYMYWFDTREGKLIVGEAAYESTVENSLPGDVRLLSDAVMARTVDFPTDYYDRVDARSWTQDDYLNYGRWIVNMLSDSAQANQFKRDHIDRLGLLGVGPGREPLLRAVGPHFNDFLMALGEPLDNRRNYRYDDWLLSDYVQYASKLANELGKPATTDEFTAASQRDEGPSPWHMTKNAGTPGQINELLGYPNVYMWQTEDFVVWGARAMDINEGTILTARMLTILSKRGRGPGFGTVKDEFGTLTEFQRQSIERYHDDPTSRQPREAKARESLTDLVVRKLVNSWQLKYIYENKVDIVEFTAKFAVINALLLDADEAEFAYIALDSTDDFISNIKRINQRTRFEDIRLTAIALGHTDDIWPLSDAWRADLRVV